MKAFEINGNSNKKVRDKSIDIVKGVLTLLMVAAHVVQFFPGGKFSNDFSVFVNLTTFSGFMFCLGYVFVLAYSDKPNYQKRIFVGFLKCLLAYFISGAAYIAIIDKHLNFTTLINILTFKLIPAYSEFLLSFALVFAVGLFLFKPLKRLTESPIKYFMLCALCLVLTGIDYSAIHSGIIGTVLGSVYFNNFPVAQYGIYFLLGFYFAQKKIIFNGWALALSALGTLAFILFNAINGYLPNRFPPSFLWIVGAALFVYLYFLAAKCVKNIPIVDLVGQNSLLILVASNVTIFTAKAIIGNAFDIFAVRAVLYIGVIIICAELVGVEYLIKTFIKMIKRKNQRTSK